MPTIKETVVMINRVRPGFEYKLVKWGLPGGAVARRTRALSLGVVCE